MVEVIHCGGAVKGVVQLPASKSISNRALIIRAVSGHHFKIENLSDAEDTVMLNSLLGNDGRELYCGEGGTTFRFMLALLALKGKERVIYGSDRLNERPVKHLVDALRELGSDIEYIKKNDFPPLYIRPSRMHGGNIFIDASVSSQFISALLLIAPSLPGGLTLRLQNRTVSAPYIKMTLQLMKMYGADIDESGQGITVHPSLYKNTDMHVESDWSAASYWLMIAALAQECDLLLPGLSNSGMQGDSVLAALAPHFGVDFLGEASGFRLKKIAGYANSSFESDFTGCPDLVPALALLCAARGMKGIFNGTGTLKHKESDRGMAIKVIVELLGGVVELEDDRLTVLPSTLNDAHTMLPVFKDHRIAMSLAPLALILDKVIIEDTAVAGKSYPAFWRELEKTGFVIRQSS